jgi:hypothetical protein
MIALRKLLALGLFAGAAAAAAPPPAQYWEIGPVIRGRNYSAGMPLRPTPVRGGLSFAFPNPDAGAGHVHALTYDHGPLAGSRRIVMRYRIDAEPGVRFAPQELPQEAATVSLFFQRAGDNWSGRGRYGGYRWYAPAAKLGPITPGTHQIAIELDDPDWTHVQGQRAGENRAAFLDALAETGRVGFVFGSPSARGHGVYATGPARFTLLDFRVE